MESESVICDFCEEIITESSPPMICGCRLHAHCYCHFMNHKIYKCPKHNIKLKRNFRKRKLRKNLNLLKIDLKK